MAQAPAYLPPHGSAELPEPPVYKFSNVMRIIGPGAILLGLSIGSGEWLLGPATTVKWGLALLWVTTVSVVLQVILNTEMARYTLYTGEPIVTGFMRTAPGRTWGWVYSILYFLQVGWPGWAATAGGALAFIYLGRLPTGDEAGTVKTFGYVTLFGAAAILLLGRRIERTLEYVNWFFIAWILLFLLVLDVFIVPVHKWVEGVTGFFRFGTIPQGADWFLLAAFAGYSGAGGMLNVSITNWLRDKGFGMGGRVGYIPALVGGKRMALAHEGVVFDAKRPENLARWRGWWRYLAVDQYWLWMGGAFLGMFLPTILATTVIEPGIDIRGLGVGARIADGVSSVTGSPALRFLTALTGFWILFSTQLGIMDGFVRNITDTLWTGSAAVRRWRGGDVRAVYYVVWAVLLTWGCIAINLAQPIVLIQLGAAMASLIFVFVAIHTFFVNRKFLPAELRPPLWREAALWVCAAFFGAFAGLWLYRNFVG
ncbi:MAG TPA: Nramp family divalent metal transporter [Gemmatimonadales bacterium]|nr:Nramp family divalent metal transporter [Gemmatimonadales bacterium]